MFQSTNLIVFEEIPEFGSFAKIAQTDVALEMVAIGADKQFFSQTLTLHAGKQAIQFVAIRHGIIPFHLSFSTTVHHK